MINNEVCAIDKNHTFLFALTVTDIDIKGVYLSFVYTNHVLYTYINFIQCETSIR